MLDACLSDRSVTSLGCTGVATSWGQGRARVGVWGCIRASSARLTTIAPLLRIHAKHLQALPQASSQGPEVEP